MKKSIRILCSFGSLFILFLMTSCKTEDSLPKDPKLIITQQFIKPTDLGRNSAAYALIHNPYKEPLIILGADIESCQKTELHTHIHENGIMKMRKVSSLTIPGKSTLKLKCGKDHIMCINAKKDLIEGNKTPIIFSILSPSNGEKFSNQETLIVRKNK